MSHWWTVYKKELVDVLRDRRTLAAMLLVPMVLYPAILLLTTETVARQQSAAKERQIKVATQPELHHGLQDHLWAQPRLILTTSVSGSPREVLAKHDIYLAMSSTQAQALDATGTATVTVYADDSRAFARPDTRRLRDIMLSFDKRTTKTRLASRGLTPEFVRPLGIRHRNVASAAETTGHILSLILPALLIVMIAVSCMYPAIDMVAGEKERKTLATLLTAPVASREFVLGKYLAVLTVGGLAGLANLAVLALTFFRVLGSQGTGAGFEFELSFVRALGLMLAVLAAAAPVSALLLLAGSFARSFRDASLLLTPVLMLCAVPAFIVGQPTTTPSVALSSIPVLGAGYALRGLLDGSLGISAALVASASALGSTALLLTLITRAFADERALFSIEGRRADFRHVVFASPQPGLATAFAFFGAVFGLSFFASGLFEAPLQAISASQLLAFLIPSVLVARWAQRDAVGFLGFTAAAPSAWMGAFICAGFAWLAVSVPLGWLSAVLIPGQEAFAQQFAGQLRLDEVPFWAVILTLAVLPAVSEELAFRGVIMKLLSPLKPQSVLLIQTLLFGLAHGSSYRFLPTAGLGLLLGYVRQRSGSVLPGIVIHLATNAILLTVGLKFKDHPQVVAWMDQPSLVFVPALVLVGSGILLLRRRG